MSSPESLIIAPIITEKGTMASEKAGQVLFKVRPGASKDKIREAVEHLFKVTVIKVRTSNFMGKERKKGAIKGRQSRLEEGLRNSEGRRQDRVLRRAIETMAVIQLNPRTPGQRFMQIADFSELTKKEPEKSLLVPVKRTGGRNNRGRMTSRHRGGGHKRRLRLIDFKRNRDGIPAVVAALEYDPNRSANIALLHYADGVKTYILAPDGLKVGAKVESGENADIKPGNALMLKNIPLGTVVHAIEMKPGAGAKLARGAGVQAQLMAKEGKMALLKLPSGEQRMVQADCRATIGQVGNLDHENISIGKAGRSRWLGKRGHVRGVAMNPVDHPHGGGEGKSKGNHPQSPWGQPAKGYKTRKKQPSDNLIVSRRPKGKH